MIVEVWLVDPVEGTQLIYVGPNHINPPSDPVVGGIFTPGEAVTLRIGFQVFAFGGDFYANVKCAGMIGTEIGWTSYGPTLTFEEWTFTSMPNVTSDVEVWCGQWVGAPFPQREETDRAVLVINPTAIAVPTELSLSHTALDVINNEPTLPQLITLYGYLTRADNSSPIAGVTVEIWAGVNQKTWLTRIAEAVTDANGFFGGDVDLIYQHYHYYVAIFRGSGIYEYTDVDLTIDLSNVFRNKIYPSAPYFCESLENNYDPPHYWENGGDGAISLDTFKSPFYPNNQYSLRKLQYARHPNFDGKIILSFEPGVIDLTEWDVMKFAIFNEGYVNPNTGSPYTFRVTVFDETNRSASQLFTAGLSQWAEMQLWIANFTNVNLTKIYRITIDVVNVSADDNIWPKTYFIDWFYFERGTKEYLALFDAYDGDNPITIPMQIIAPWWTRTIMTPSTLRLPQENGTSYTVIVNEVRFKEWENGETNPTRTFVPTEDTSIIAYYNPIVQHKLMVKSSPEGKNVKLDGITFQTNYLWRLTPGIYIVEMLDTDGFLKWEDNSTNPKREIDLQSDTEVTAYYEGGTNGGDGKIPDYYLFYGFLGLSSAVATYYLWRWLK